MLVHRVLHAPAASTSGEWPDQHIEEAYSPILVLDFLALAVALIATGLPQRCYRADRCSRSQTCAMMHATSVAAA
jgi:hypothetical protein